MNSRVVILWALVALGATPAVRAEIVTNTASKDNTLYQLQSGATTNSNGAGNSFFAGATDNGYARRGLIAFNLSAIPAGSTINSATLTCYLSRTRAQAENVSVHRVLADWGEGTSHASGEEGQGAPATANDATWVHRFYPGTFWSTPGGDFNATASATIPVNKNGYYAWSSADVTGDVQAWANAPSGNFGWLVKGIETGNKTSKRFESRQSTDATQRPILVVNFTPPAGTGACFLPNGDCVVTTAAGCASQGGTYQGNGTSCPPPPAFGACCFSNGTCVVTNTAGCATLGGNYQGDDTTCTPNPCPVVLAPFVDALPIPGVLTPVSNQYYEVPIQQVVQQLHRDLPPTTVWGYNGTFPGPTIVATVGQPTTVKWINDLRDGAGNLRTNHFLPVDLCVHGPDTEGATARVVTHLHGGHVPPESDGYPTNTILPGQSRTDVYPNNQLPATLWFHDHALGITRLNVIMGLAGFYLLFDAFEQSLGLPAGEYEIGLAIQDRKFNPDGSFSYPAAWEEMFLGDTMLVNGKVWPYLNVKKGKYRFRLLNGCTSRTLTLGLSNAANFQQIGTEGGLLPAPVTTNSITIGAGERVDVVFDFAPYSTGTRLILQNSGDLTNVMKFIVGASAGHTGAIPGTLRPMVSLSESNSVQSRNFILRKMNGPCAGTMWAINDLLFEDITEFPVRDTTEVWNFVNPSGVMHPMHMHLVMFQLLDRQACTVSGTNITTSGPRIPAAPTEAGWKDTVQCPPNMVTRVIARFDDYLGLYPYHCHILEHEENEMMRQFQVVSPPAVTGLRLVGNDLLIDCLSTTNRLHKLEVRDGLEVGSWSVLQSNRLGTGAALTFTNQNAAPLPKRFYRIGLQP